MKVIVVCVFMIAGIVSCKQQQTEQANILPTADTTTSRSLLPEKVYHKGGGGINTGNTSPQQLLSYAQSLIGTPYKYGSIDPEKGFDCSGFITHIFNHFKIKVPRSSREYTNASREVRLDEAKPGDIVLFTGTNHAIRQVGHMGLITASRNGIFEFIHSSSGKAQGVTVTPLAKSYISRFMKIIRVFKDNDTE